MIKEYDKVKIRESGIIGEVVDIYSAKGETIYTVESDKRGVPGGFGLDGGYKLFDCVESDLEVIKDG